MQSRTPDDIIDRISSRHRARREKMREKIKKQFSDEEDIRSNRLSYLEYTDWDIKNNIQMDNTDSQSKQFKIVTILAGQTLTLNDTVLDAAIIHVRGKLILNNSSIKCLRIKIHEHAQLQTNSGFILTDSLVHCGMIGNENDNQQGLLIIHCKDFTVSTTGHLKHSYFLLETEHFLNNGQVEIQEWAGRTDYFINWGKIKTHQFNVDANRMMLNIGYFDNDLSTINTACYFNFWDFNSPTQFNLNALLGFSPGPLRSNHINLHVLLQGTINALPTLPRALSDVFDWQLVKSGIIQLASSLFPMLMMPIQFLYSASNTYQSIDLSKIRNLFKLYQEGNLQIADALPVLTQIYSNALAIKGGIEEIKYCRDHFDFTNVTSISDVKFDVTTLGKKAISLYGSELESHTIFAIHGLELMGNIQEASLYGVNLGCQKAFNITSHHVVKKINKGIISCDSLTETGREIIHDGTLDTNHLNCDAESLTFSKDSSTNVPDAKIYVDTFDHEGQSNLNGASAKDIIYGTNGGTAIHIREQLKIKTSDAIILDEPLKRDINHEITATALTLKKEIKRDINLSLRTTQDDLKIEADIHTRNLELTTARDFNNNHQVKADIELKVQAQRNINNAHTFEGQITTVKGKNITNQSNAHQVAKIIGKEKLVVRAEDDINNVAYHQSYQGPYGTRYQNIESQLIGGSGNGDGVGADIHAGNSITNNSNIEADGDVIAIARNGIESSAFNYDYISYEKKSKKMGGLYKKHVRETDTEVFKPKISSKQGRVTVASNGLVKCIANDIQSSIGAIISGKNIQLNEIKAQKTTFTSKSHAGGLVKSSYDNSYQESVPTKVKNDFPGLTIIEADDQVSLLGAQLDCPGKLKFTAKKITMKNKPNKHHEVTKTSRVTIKLLGLGDNKEGLRKTHQNPLISQLKNRNGSAPEIALESYQLMNDLKSAIDKNQVIAELSKQSGITDAMRPTISIGYTKSKNESHWETSGDGFVQTDDLEMKATEIHIRGVSIRAHDADIDAKKIILEGEQLKASVSHKKDNITASFSTAGKSISLSQTRAKQSSIVSTNLNLTVDGKLKLKSEETRATNTNFEAGSHDIEIKKLSLESLPDEFISKSSSHTISSHGQFQSQKLKTHQKQVNHTSGFHSEMPITEDSFKIGECHLIDAEITSKREVDIDQVKFNKTQSATINYTKTKSTSANIMKILSLSENRTPAVNKLNAEQSLNHDLSKLVYEDDYGQTNLSSLGVEYVDRYHDPETSTHIAVYKKDNHIYVAFRGTDGLRAAATDDIDIVLHHDPKSVNANMRDFIENIQSQFPKADFSLTGHSRGAAQAAIISSDFKLPAIIFENPGVGKQHDLSQVTNIEFTPNLINQHAQLFNHPNRTTTTLLPTPMEQLKTLATDVAALAAGGNVANALDTIVKTKQAHALR
ncbi:MAG: DUF2974 domain-containing protein [Gammaproteobacteria bacterium]|nr:DUF2974 domain-containing protein [Gammaproteobacteria bacterium]